MTQLGMHETQAVCVPADLWLVWVLVAPLCCHNRIIDSKGVVGTDSLPSAEGAASARTESEPSRPAAQLGLPAVCVTSWTSITVPPNLLSHANM